MEGGGTKQKRLINKKKIKKNNISASVDYASISVLVVQYTKIDLGKSTIMNTYLKNKIINVIIHYGKSPLNCVRFVVKSCSLQQVPD